MANAQTPAARKSLSPPALALAVGGATFVSTMWGILTQHFFVPSARSLPFAFWLVAAGLNALWVAIVVSGGPLDELVHDALLEKPPGQPFKDEVRLRAGVWYGALYVLTFGCIFLLGWFTTTTGGVLKTSYSAPLLGFAALAPRLARKARTTALTLLCILVVAGIFAIKPPSVDIPGLLDFGNFALGIAVAGAVEVLRQQFGSSQPIVSS